MCVRERRGSEEGREGMAYYSCYARVAVRGEREAVAGGEEGIQVAREEVDVVCRLFVSSAGRWQSVKHPVRFF